MSWSLYFTGDSELLNKELPKIADAIRDTAVELHDECEGVTVIISISGHFDPFNSSVARSVSKAMPPTPVVSKTGAPEVVDEVPLPKV